MIKRLITLIFYAHLNFHYVQVKKLFFIIFTELAFVTYLKWEVVA
ncbi:hypothetical protein ACSVDA_24700 [Cytobacillus sp. Hm23]